MALNTLKETQAQDLINGCTRRIRLLKITIGPLGGLVESEERKDVWNGLG
jgi:hypothetical protein